MLFIYIFRKWSCILFIKGLKSLRQLLGAKNVVALFLPNFLLFIYIFRKWSCILFIKGRKSLRQLFGAENIVKSNVLKGFYYLSFGRIINDFFITRIRPRVNPNPYQWFFIIRIGSRVNPNPLSIYISFRCIYETHPIASTKMYDFYRWCSLNWRVEGWIEWDLEDLKTNLRSVRLSFE